MTQQVHTAQCRRSGKWLAISVPELNGVHTQARHLDQVEATAREAIALMLDMDPAAISVTVRTGHPISQSYGARHRDPGRRATGEATIVQDLF